jgi:hypothetical protein
VLLTGWNYWTGIPLTPIVRAEGVADPPDQVKVLVDPVLVRRVRSSSDLPIDSIDLSRAKLARFHLDDQDDVVRYGVIILLQPVHGVIDHAIEERMLGRGIVRIRLEIAGDATSRGSVTRDDSDRRRLSGFQSPHQLRDVVPENVVVV